MRRQPIRANSNLTRICDEYISGDVAKTTDWVAGQGNP